MVQRISSIARSELIIKKSRFIGCVQPVADRAGALAVVADLRSEHTAATHVCWALLAGGQSAAVDDGEPSGTAGRPMLDVLRHHDLDGVLATVVRYFGGVKLGAGGLIRAYSGCVAQALQDAGKVPAVANKTLRCTVPYAFEGVLRRQIEATGGVLQQASHSVRVELVFTLPQDVVSVFMMQLNEVGQGQIIWGDSV